MFSSTWITDSSLRLLKWNCCLVRLKAIALIANRRFVKAVSSCLENGSNIYFRAPVWSSKGWNLRNCIKEKRSSRLFCIGVPVKHHRLSACKFMIAWNIFVDRFRIWWASRVKILAVLITENTWLDYLHLRLYGTMELLVIPRNWWNRTEQFHKSWLQCHNLTAF